MIGLRAIVVEDQAPAREHLVDLVNRAAAVEVVAVCADGRSAINALRDVSADVVLLDIQMPECDGFQVIEAVGAARMPAVIFITAFDDYAIPAFGVRALDYVLKPFSSTEIARALERARDHVRDRRLAGAARALADLVDRPAGASQTTPLTLRQRGKLMFVAPADVELVRSRGNDVLLYTRQGEFRYRATLGEIHRRLGDAFIKVHRSALVNLAAVSPVLLTDGGTPRLLVGSRSIRISKALRADIERRLSSLS